GHNKTIHVEPKVMQVLVCLAEHAGEVVPKERLIKSVWEATYVTDDVLTRSISELRKLFQDDAKEPRFIQTIPKSGYRLIAPVSRDGARQAVELPKVAVVSEPEMSTPRQRGWHVKGLSLAVVLLGLGIGVTVWLYLTRHDLKSSLPPMKVVPFTSYP